MGAVREPADTKELAGSTRAGGSAVAPSDWADLKHHPRWRARAASMKRTLRNLGSSEPRVGKYLSVTGRNNRGFQLRPTVLH